MAGDCGQKLMRGNFLNGAADTAMQAARYKTNEQRMGRSQLDSNNFTYVMSEFQYVKHVPH